MTQYRLLVWEDYVLVSVDLIWDKKAEIDIKTRWIRWTTSDQRIREEVRQFLNKAGVKYRNRR